MNDGSLRNATLKPLIAPRRPPKTIASGMPSNTGSPQVVMKVADITAHSAMPVPTERSIPPVMMTSVAPSESRPTTTAEKRIVVTLPNVGKTCGLAIENTTKMISRPPKANSCCNERLTAAAPKAPRRVTAASSTVGVKVGSVIE